MKFRLSIFILMLILFIFQNSSVSQTYTNNRLENKKNQLIELERKKESLKIEKEKFLKLYITFYIKRLYKKDSSEFLKDPNYLAFINEEERFKFIEKALIRKILNLKKEEEVTEIAYNKILKDIEKERIKEILKTQKVYAVNPLDGKPIELGNHVLRTKSSLSILAPIAGIIKGIAYKQNNIHVIIENEKCKATISGLDEVVVNIGDGVLRKQIIGNVKGDKNLHFFVDCKKDVSSNSS